MTTAIVSVLAVLCAMAMGGVGKDLFSLFQSIIGYFAPPMAAVFLAACSGGGPPAGPRS